MDFKNNKDTISIIENITDIDFANADIETYLGICANLVNDSVHNDFTIDELKKILKIILDENFNFRKLNRIKTYEKWVHEFVVEIIKIELNKFRKLYYDFSKFYIRKLNDDYILYYNCQYCESSLNNRGINQAYQILKQIAEFKQVIDFDN